MARESFAHWQIPPQVEGVVLLEDFAKRQGRIGLDQRHHHDELEIHLVARGRGAFLLGEERIAGDAGTLLWVPPGSDHTLLEASRDFCRWMLLFRRRLVRRVLPPNDSRALLESRSVSRTPADLCRTLPPRPLRALIETFTDTRAQIGEAMSLYNTAIAHALACAFQAFRAADSLPASSTLHPSVAKAVRLLRETSPPPSRTELARRCGLSEWHLSKLFAAQTGVSLIEFRNRCRLDRFLELYGDGSRVKMTAAALDAGFGSYPQFYRVFRAHMGYAPGEHGRRATGAREI